MPPKPKTKAQPKAAPSKADQLKKKLDGMPEACQPLLQHIWSQREGWRDEQRALILAAVGEAIHATHTAVAGATMGKLAELHATLDTKTLVAVEDFVDRIEPFGPDTLPDSLHGKLMRQRIEEAVDGVDDDIESFAEYVSDPDLCPKETLEGEHLLAEGFYQASPEQIGAQLSEFVNDSRTLDAEIFWCEVIHNLTPQHRCTIAAILAAS